MTGHQSNHREHALYRFFGVSGQLLYVGITLDPGARWKQHSKEKPWWHDVVGITVERHPTREAVLEAERDAIITEKPAHNVVYNRGQSAPTGWPAEAMPDMCHDHCVPAGDFTSWYYPHRWTRGIAEYQCAKGHTWTCAWGHRGSGQRPLNAGRNQAPTEWKTA